MDTNKKQFDEYAESYDEGLKDLLGPLGGSDLDKWGEYKVALLDILLKNEEVNTILDFGCGTGRSLMFFDDYFHKKDLLLYGCDVSGESLEVAKKNVPHARFFMNETVDDLRSQDLKLDLVLIACVLHHIDPKDRVAWINQLEQMLNVNGKIAIFEHNVYNPVTKRIVMDPSNPVDDIDWMLSMRELESLLIQNENFRIYWKGYVLFSPIRNNWILNFERILKWLPLGAQQCIIIEKIR